MFLYLITGLLYTLDKNWELQGIGKTINTVENINTLLSVIDRIDQINRKGYRILSEPCQITGTNKLMNYSTQQQQIRTVHHCKLYKFQCDNKEIIMNNMRPINLPSWVKWQIL